ncbi:MAG: DNA-processing protein DprA [Lachnospiraceae bacterium]
MKYDYWMHNITGIGSKKIRYLLQYAGSTKEVFSMKEAQLAEIPNIHKSDREKILKSAATWDVDGEYNKLTNAGIRFISKNHDHYPEKLTHIVDSPFGIYVKGSLEENLSNCAAIVGSRTCSEYGGNMARAFAERLAANGVTIVSGMAYGIDSAAHYGALKAGGKTLAVLGCGVNVCYPEKAEKLFRTIPEHGALISEYHPDAKPVSGYFPQRNRLISALADLVLIMEAREKSGSLITADFALEQGKDIYALPGRVSDDLSRGCNRLIQQGAGILVSPEELLLEMGINADKHKKNKVVSKNLLEKEELLLYSCFDLYSRSINELVQNSGLPIYRVTEIIGILIQKGLIEETFINCYKKT